MRKEDLNKKKRKNINRNKSISREEHIDKGKDIHKISGEENKKEGKERIEDWFKTLLAAVAVVVLTLLFGNRNAFWSWLESLLAVGVLAAGYYAGIPGGLAAGVLAGLVQGYFKGELLIPVTVMTVSGAAGALFLKLGKAAAGIGFLSATVLIYLLLGQPISTEGLNALLLAILIFLILRFPKRKKIRKTRKGEKIKEPVSVYKTAVNAESAVNQSWRRLSDSLISLSHCFDDQSALLKDDGAYDEMELSAQEWKQRFMESREVIRLQFQQMGQVIREQQEKLSALQDITGRYEKRLMQQLQQHHVKAEYLQIVETSQGRQEMFASLACTKGSTLSTKELASFLYTENGKKFWPAYDCRTVISARTGEIHLVEKQQFQILHGVARKVKEGETCSGDSFSARMLGEDRMLLCLSDGMGTGRRAGLESEMAVELLEQLLENEFSLAASLSMVNHVLMNGKNQQNPTTIDISLLNLYSGMCQFVKMGAVAGYLKRGNEVTAICGQNVPMGIFSIESFQEDLIPQQQLQSGDMLIMMTDGVMEKDDFSSDEKLRELISQSTLYNAEEMANWLMEQVLLSDPVVHDDMTILVAGVWKK